jgi:nucleosome-remodeling factor subunit BPTF
MVVKREKRWRLVNCSAFADSRTMTRSSTSTAIAVGTGCTVGRCVGVLQTESESIDEYTCPNCEPQGAFNYANTKTLGTRDYEELRKLLRQLQTHKSSWPFREPVDVKDVPDYYQVIKDPMDLQMVETKIIERRYQRLVEFIGDITKIFENCRYYNPKGSNFYRCATSLESFFVPRLKLLRSSMSN